MVAMQRCVLLFERHRSINECYMHVAMHVCIVGVAILCYVLLLDLLHIDIRVYIYIYIHTHVCIHAYVYACVHAYIYIYI